MATAKKTDTKVVPFPGDPEVTADLSRALGLSDSEVARATKELGRNLTHAELGVLSVMWSEREAQKTARVHTRRLPTSGAHVVRSETDSGAVDLGDGHCAVLTVASSCDESTASAAPESFGEALRGVLARGAKPLAALDALRFGPPDDAATKQGLRALASGLGSYAKESGVPVIGGDLQFERNESGASFALTVALGVVRTESLIEGKAAGFGNTVVWAGSPAGSSEGDPSLQRKLTDGCLTAYKLGSVESAQPVGASGLAGAAARLSARGETGVELDLDAVPRKERGLSPYGVLCSAHGERVLLVVKKGREDSVLEAFRERGIEARVIGRVTNTQRLVCKASPDTEASAGKGNDAKQVVAVDLPVALLAEDAPSYERPLKPGSHDERAPEVSLKRNEDAESELVRLLGSVNVGSREWLARRLDASARAQAGAKIVQSDAGVLQVSCGDDEAQREKQLAISVDGNARYAGLDPRQGAAMSVAEGARNLVCTGAEPLGLVYALSVGHPDDPENVWRLSESVDGVRDACLALKVPVVAGGAVLRARSSAATAHVAVLGVLRDPADRLGMGFGRQADMVALLGAVGTGNLAASEFVVSRSGELRGRPLTIDLGAEVKLQRAVLELARDRLLSSAHDVSDGGLGVTLAECCIAGRIGCSVELPDIKGADTLQKLFHEEPSRIVVSFPPEQRAKVQERCEALGVPFTLLGFVGGDTLEIEDVLDVPVQVLAESHTRALQRVVED